MSIGYITTTSAAKSGTDVLNNNLVKVYPQPFRSDINIDWNNNELFKKNVTVDVYDLLGQNRFHGAYTEVNDKLDLDMSELNPGIYIVTIYTPSNKLTYKLQKL